MAHQNFEKEQIAYARRIVLERDIAVFIDIGANLGFYSIQLGQYPFIEEVHSFEPLRRHFNQLCANIWLNKLDAKITPHNMALSDEEGAFVLHIDPTNTGRARTDNTLSGDKERFTLQERVECKVLDHVVAYSQKNIFIKIDVEGHAIRVLQGMDSLLQSNSCTLQIELLPEDKQIIIARMEQLGYKLEHEIGGDGYFSNKP